MTEGFHQSPASEAAPISSQELQRLCEKLGYDTDLQTISENPETYALFLYNDAGTLAEMPEIYEQVAHQLELETSTYTYEIERWKDTFPYLKVAPK
jgi:hypothetical protein